MRAVAGWAAMIDRRIDAVTRRAAIAQRCRAAHGREIVLETFSKTNIFKHLSGPGGHYKLADKPLAGLLNIILQQQISTQSNIFFH